MSTDTKKLEEVFLRDLFNDDKTHNYDEIKAKGQTVLGDNYSNGKVSGLINKLQKNNRIIRTDRGKYKKSENYKVDIENLTNKSLEKALNEIKANLSKVNVSNLTDDEFKKLDNVRNIIKSLEGFLL